MKRSNHTKARIISANKPTLFTRVKLYKKTPISVLAKKVIRRLHERIFEFFYLPNLRNEFNSLKLSGHAIQKLLDDHIFDTVLDVGSGEGIHTDIFVEYGKNVTAIDYGKSAYFEQNISSVKTIVADFNNYDFDCQFDVVWCSHVLEHQLNVNLFLEKANSALKDGGYLAVTVPPSRNTIVGSHVTNLNAGLLIYNLVLAGFDCSDAKILQYGYNISVIAKKSSKRVNKSELSFDNGDIRLIRRWLPKFDFFSTETDDPFYGTIRSYNWNN
jgi:SAM-dependent methyltransferase